MFIFSLKIWVGHGIMLSMNTKKIFALFLAVLLPLGATGCGQSLVDMTGDEEAAVVAYASHVVSKYNKRQPDGLKRVFLSEEVLAEDLELGEKEDEPDSEAAETEVEEETESSKPKDTTGGSTRTASSASPDEEEEIEGAGEEGSEEVSSSEPVSEPLGEFLGFSGLTIDWTYTEVTNNFVSNDAMSISAGNGNVYVVLTMELTNGTMEDIPVDILSLSPKFTLLYSGQETSGKTVQALTILPTDLSTYTGTVPAGGHATTQLFFLRKAEKVTSDDVYALDVSYDGRTDRIM